MADAKLTSKKCTQCGEVKSLSSFYKRHDRPGHWRAECKACMAARPRFASYYQRNRERILKRARERYQENPEAFRERSARQKRTARRRAWEREWESQPRVRLRKRISLQIYLMLRGGKSGIPAEGLVDWTIEELRTHLERQFTEGMTWDNIGEWHIDHIVPLSSFKITGPDDPELRRAWALTNLRPLWATDNLRKGARRTHLL